MSHSFIPKILHIPIGLVICLTLAFSAIGQTNTIVPHCQNEAFHQEVADYVDPSTVPLIDVADLKQQYADYIVLDAREEGEFKVSHLPGAFYVGYDDFDLGYLPEMKKDHPIAVYCSIGYRSEKIAKVLRENGYQKVLNVYGSIFEWANRGYPLQNMKGNETIQLHTYNHKWSKWVVNPDIIKTW